jgi:two-component system sensor histidine kinase KdpD
VRSALDELVRLVPLAGACLHVVGDEELRVPAGDTSRAEHAVAGMEVGSDAAPRVRSLRYEGRVRVFPEVGGEGSLGLLAADPGDRELDEERWALVEGFADLVGLGVARARLEGERTRRQALEATDRLRAALTRSVTHDLRTPVAAIRAAAGAMRTTADPEVRAGLLDDIDRQAARLTDLVSDMLDLSRIESGALRVDRVPTPVDLLVNEAVDAVPGAWQRVEVDVDPTLAPVMLDETLMRQALVNLVHNAVVHTADGPIVVTARDADGALELRVADRGPGIPEAERPRVFEPYRRLRPVRSEGTGLGLAITRGYVEAHHGTITVETTPGGGATFVIRLPHGP